MYLKGKNKKVMLKIAKLIKKYNIEIKDKLEITGSNTDTQIYTIKFSEE